MRSFRRDKPGRLVNSKVRAASLQSLPTRFAGTVAV